MGAMPIAILQTSLTISVVIRRQTTCLLTRFEADCGKQPGHLKLLSADAVPALPVQDILLSPGCPGFREAPCNIFPCNFPCTVQHLVACQDVKRQQPIHIVVLWQLIVPCKGCTGYQFGEAASEKDALTVGCNVGCVKYQMTTPCKGQHYFAASLKQRRS